MNFPNFTRIERETAGGKSRHFVIHTREPRLTIEIIPDASAPDHVGEGVIRSVTVPNSWSGQYSQYSQIIAKAQAFFRASFAQPGPAGRFATR